MRASPAHLQIGAIGLWLAAFAFTGAACSTYRNDRDRESFWRRDHQKRFGSELVLLVPKGRVLRLHENLNPLQFHGATRSNARLHPSLKSGPVINAGDVTEVITDRRGDSIVLVENAPAGGTGTSAPAREATADPVPALISTESGRLVLINIYSYGGGRMRVEAESENDRHAYYVWVVESIRVKSE